MSVCDQPAVSIHISVQYTRRTQGGGGEGKADGLKTQSQPPTPEGQNSKYTDFVDTMISKVTCDLRFSLNRLMTGGLEYRKV